MPMTGKCAGGDWELFVLMGEASGSGLPLGWLFVCSKRKNTPLNAKRDILIQWLQYFQDEWSIYPHFTLSDKDHTEINAFRSVWPKADYQLCYWHVLCAVRKRLSVQKRTPAPYTVDHARRVFEFVDRYFVPVAQRSQLSKEDVSYTIYR